MKAKRLLGIFLVLCMLLSALPVSADAALNSGVTRIYGSNRYQTAFNAADRLKERLGVAKFDNVIVACGTDFADALAGSYLAAQKNAPILLVHEYQMDNVKDYIKENLNPGGTVYLLGGENAISANMEKGLDGFTVKRLAGSNRYDTNLMILEEAGVEDKDIIVCTGSNFADSLSASAVGLPILLVPPYLLPAQKEFLSGISGNIIIVGGESAVNKDVENALTAYGNVKRLAGANRYETSILVAKEFFRNPTSAVVAYALNFPDGLSGGPLAYAMGAPLILTVDAREPVASAYTNPLGITKGHVLGGPGLISDSTANRIFAKKSAPEETEHQHTYIETITPPTCTEHGYTTHTCSCGESYKDNYISAKGHSWGSWSVTKSATCTEEGSESRVCSSCNSTESRDVSATGHNYSEVDRKEPSCTEAGYVTRKCGKCDHSYIETLEKIDHSWVNHDAEGHYEIGFLCRCGWSCTESQASNAGYDIGTYFHMLHVKQFPENEWDHSYSGFSNWVEDAPAYKSCSICGIKG